ncbi:Peptidase S24 [Phytophthora palmivora]|uniref:Peptidase S24 n=1 Tax=Phytophthora palmivora TaxID=4796 RepID=A0A2P4XQK1_9STRA|nr:Peptidase S24 [Phytophthora palmivora]
MTHAQKYRQRIKRRANSKSRGKATREPWAKTADDVFTKHTAENKSNSATEILKVVGDEKLEWWETPLQHEAVQLEPLPLLQVCELPQQFTQELSVTDPLLLDELQQLIAPVAGDVLLEAGNWDGDELLELLIGTMDD